MINDLLLMLSIILITIGYINILFNYLKTKKIEIDDIKGFDIAKELTDNYNEINIVESKEIGISKYNLKRNIIRLTKKDYESKNIFTLSIVSLLSGYSLLNIQKEKNIQLLNNIFPNIDYINKSSILTILISIFINKVGDAKIGIVLLTIILIYQYLINEINTTSKEELTSSIKKIISKENHNNVEKVQKSILLLNKISFITTLILIIRLVIIIIK